MAIRVRIIIEAEHIHLRPLEVVKKVRDIDAALAFAYQAGQEGFFYGVALAGGDDYMTYVPPCRIVRVSFVVDAAPHAYMVDAPREMEWGEL